MKLLIFVLLTAFGAVRGDPIATATTAPAARFWKEALPGSPLPEAILEAIGRGVEITPFVSSQAAWPQSCFGTYWGAGCFSSHSDVDIAACFGSYKDGDRSCSDLVATISLFFHETDVQVGNVMTLSSVHGPEMAILPRKVADKIPFENIYSSSSSSSSRKILQMFHIVPGSPAAADVQNTLQKCVKPTVEKKHDKQQACATSLEGVVEVAMRMLGTPSLQAVASALPSSGLPRQAYVVHAVRPLNGSVFIACHRQPYPYAIYYCHSTGLSKAYKMSIASQAGGAGATTIHMVAVCHEETSQWNPNYPAFKALQTQPGGSPICHYLPYGDLLFGEI